MLDPSRPAIAMAAHSPLAAKLAAEAGFDAIWGSGFELPAAYAVPDANILSVDTHLDLMRAIGEVQDKPVVADIDTGYGNAVNADILEIKPPTHHWRSRQAPPLSNPPPQVSPSQAHMISC